MMPPCWALIWESHSWVLGELSTACLLGTYIDSGIRGPDTRIGIDARLIIPEAASVFSYIYSYHRHELFQNVSTVACSGNGHLTSFLPTPLTTLCLDQVLISMEGLKIPHSSNLRAAGYQLLVATNCMSNQMGREDKTPIQATCRS